MQYMNQKGFTLIELVVTLAIVALLASVTMPMIQLNVKRAKEAELRRYLWQMRDAIDAYKKAVDDGLIEKKADESGYPPSLSVLVEGVDNKKEPKKNKLKFLRRIPVDPLLSKEAYQLDDAETYWGLRSYKSDVDNPQAGDDVYDVFSLSTETGINGVPYAQW